MPHRRRRDPIFRYRRHEDGIIVRAVQWYISYRLSFRDVTEMLGEGGIDPGGDIRPSTIWRSVHRYVLELEKRWDRLRRRTRSSWRVDETDGLIRGRWFSPYRAV
jgi:transposase-like protein